MQFCSNKRTQPHTYSLSTNRTKGKSLSGYVLAFCGLYSQATSANFEPKTLHCFQRNVCPVVTLIPLSSLRSCSTITNKAIQLKALRVSKNKRVKRKTHIYTGRNEVRQPTRVRIRVSRFYIVLIVRVAPLSVQNLPMRGSSKENFHWELRWTTFAFVLFLSSKSLHLVCCALWA